MHHTPVTDMSKSRAYVVTDLVTKVISSIALVALGIAGWQFQVRTEAARVASETYKDHERLFLPELRSLTEAEFVLDDVAYRLRHYRARTTDECLAAYYLGNQVRVAASTLFLPDGDSTRMTRMPVLMTRDSHYKPLPLKAGLLLLAEILRAPLQLNFQRGGPPEFVMSADQSELQLLNPDGSTSSYHVSEGSLPAWRILLGSKSIPMRSLIGPHVRWFAEDLRLHLAEAGHDVVLKHPVIGDRYVEIRSDIFKEMQASVARRNEPPWPISKRKTK